MDELAAAAAVVPMAIDDDGKEELLLEDGPGTSVSDDVRMPDDDDLGMDKENEGDLPGDRQQQAADRKVRLRPRT